MFHVVIYYTDGLTIYVGSYETAGEACGVAASYCLYDKGKITIAKF